MSKEAEPSASIVVEETYTYDIEIGSFNQITCTSATGRVRVVVPYDGRRLKPDDEPVTLGRFIFSTDTPALIVQPPELSLQLPAGASLVNLLRSGREAVWNWQYAPPLPKDTLLAVDAAIIDGAAFSPAMTEAQLTDLLFGTTDAFVSDLRLQLDLWMQNRRAAWLVNEQDRELRHLLQEQESDTQIFLPDADIGNLAESLAALANGSGGRIIIGIRANQIVGLQEDLDTLQSRLLQAALKCVPPVVFTPPDILIGEGNKQVAKVVVPAAQGVNHVVNGRRPVRSGAKTISEIAPSLPVETMAPPPIGDLRWLLSAGGGTDVIVLGSPNSILTVDELGRAICALINSASGQGYIVARYLTTPKSGFLGLRRIGVPQYFEQILEQAGASLAPAMFRFYPAFATLDGENVAVLRIKPTHPTVATFRDGAYEWTGAVIRPFSYAELYRRYMERMGQPLRQSKTGDHALLSFGELYWPVQPPSIPKLAVTQRADNDRSLAQFDEQRRAMVWRDLPFAEREGAKGLVCSLTTRLNQAFFGENGMEGASGQTGLNSGDSGMPNVLRGKLKIQLDDTLISGLECLVETEHPLLKGVPVAKRTFLIANITIYANEIFERRRRVSLFHFQVPDINFDETAYERIGDLHQICADLGFWLEKSFVQSLPRGTVILLRGIRNAGYQDITLTLGVMHSTTQMDRELRFEQRIDRKQLKTGLLDVRIMLSGVGQKSDQEMVRLQLELGRLTKERLHYLRAE